MEYGELVKAALEGNFSSPAAPSVEKQIEEDLLTPKPVFSQKWLNAFHPSKHLDASALSVEVGQPPVYDPRIRLQFTRTGLEGRITSMKLAPVPAPSGAAGETGAAGDMSLTRRMGSKKNAVRGRAGQMPFTPGGLDISENSMASELHHNEHGLLDTAPGLSRTAKLSSEGVDSLIHVSAESSASSVSDLDSDVETETESVPATEDDDDDDSRLKDSKFGDIDELLPPTSSFVRNVVKNTNLGAAAPKEKTWAHMVDINRSMTNFHELVPNPARTWPFELDNFQKEAVYHLEQGDSVFIAAHTSAGKTVVAEYAMSMAAQHMTKCIYTSPIKALSNQKYRDFKQEYDDVGILTGDVQLNPDASTLIMTTEILRSMLYRGADIIRDVEFIIFDEVHYVNDSERGVVWEEVIIMLPDHVKLVLLSATVPNTFEFANWVGRTKEKDVYVISTPKRPVPLQHHLWVKNKPIELVGADRKFNMENYRAAESMVVPKKDTGSTRGGIGGGGRGGSARGGSVRGGRGGGSGGGRGGGSGGRGGGASGQKAMQRQMGPQKGKFNSGTASKTVLLDLVEHLRTNKLLPAVFFVFSRKMCEQYAEFMQSVSLNTQKEKSQVFMMMQKATDRLRKEDRDLPQIQTLRTLLQNGIGVHHSGLLPIMKEVVEILFAKGLVKLLFATETFAMGLNLPTRTVVFTSVKKFDSKTMRYLTPGEYTQMAGRAGRRGLDSVGTVYIMNTAKDELIPSNSLNTMMLGTPLKLSSQFRLTYNMILSLLRIEALRVEDVIQQSFSENSQHVLRPEREKALVKLEKTIQDEKAALNALQQKTGIEMDLVSTMTEYHNIAASYHRLTVDAYWAAQKDLNFSNRFCLYRSYGNSSLMVGVIVRIFFDKRFKVVTLGSLHGSGTLFPYYITKAKQGDDGTWPRLFQFSTLAPKVIDQAQIELISGIRLKESHKSKSSTKSEEFKNQMLKAYTENTDAVFTEVNMAGVKSIEARLALRDRDEFEEQMKLSAASLNSSMAHNQENNGGVNLKTLLSQYEELYTKIGKIASAEREVIQIRNTATASNTALLPDYEQRMNVLKASNYVDEGLNVALKGRVACEISTGYELYVTELIMDNFLGSYEPEEIVALLSAFVFEGARGAEDPPTVTPRLDEGKARLLELVDYVQKLAIKNQVSLTDDEADFAENNRFALMQVVYEWARGMTFSEITTLTTIQEGLIVRVINRLDEVCRSVMSAARIIGEVNLYDKLAIAQERIKRDIVFCSSLYL